MSRAFRGAYGELVVSYSSRFIGFCLYLTLHSVVRHLVDGHVGRLSHSSTHEHLQHPAPLHAHREGGAGGRAGTRERGAPLCGARMSDVV